MGSAQKAVVEKGKNKDSLMPKLWMGKGRNCGICVGTFSLQRNPGLLPRSAQTPWPYPSSIAGVIWQKEPQVFVKQKVWQNQGCGAL